MPESQSGSDASQENGEAIEYPTNHVVAILDTQDASVRAIDALVKAGFLESEIELYRGAEEADRLHGGSGRAGFRDWWIRLFESVGLKNAETEMKDRYEQGLRAGGTVLAVMAPTDERKDLASRIISDCSGHFINFFGHLSVERLVG